MSFNSCRLCFSTSVQLNSSLDDEIVVKFLDLVSSIELCDNPKLTTRVCQLCYGKAKLLNDFVSKINESQAKFKTTITRNSIKPPVCSSSSDIIRKMQRNSGISIKRIQGEKRAYEHEPEIVICSDDDDDDPHKNNLLEEVNLPKSSFTIEDDDDEDNFSVNDNDESDEDFKPNYSSRSKIKPKATPKPNAAVFIDAPINFTCAKCKETFSDFPLLAEHMKSRSCFKEVIKCKECGKEFGTKKNLYAHTQVHKKKEKVMCELCAKECHTQFDLDVHIESVHRRVVKKDCIFRCTICNEAFESHLDLLQHVKQHNQERKDAPRLCEICAKVCPNQKSYQAHMANHRDKKTFVCEICKKGFSKGFQLTQHMHIHTGIKAFTCDICQRAYAKRESLRVHKKKEHPN